MRCVHRSFDHTEAEIVAGLLREEGCAAFVFENGLSRLKWYEVIAFGGARVMVPDACFEQACDVLGRWQRGDYRLDDDEQCPRCHSNDIEENPNYRGWAFFFGCFLGLPIWPVLKWRERCNACGLQWRTIPPDNYADASKPMTEVKPPARAG